MRTVLSALAISVGMLVGAQQAAAQVTVPPQPAAGPTPSSFAQNGGLLLTVWNDSKSVLQYLGLTLNQISEPLMTPEAGLVLDFGTVSGFSALSAGTGTVYYSVSAAYQGDGSLTSILATTALAAPVVTNGGLNAAVAAHTDFIDNRMNGITFGDPTAGCDGINPCIANAATDLQYAGDSQNFGAQLGGLGAPVAATLNTALNFYEITGSSDTSFFLANPAVAYQNATGLGKWLLSDTGHLTYTILGGGPVVPLPAAVWLLASGLAGLAGVARRRNAVAA